MKGSEFIINFIGDTAFLTAEKGLTFKQLDLPSIAKRYNEPASWTIRVLNHIPSENRIFAEILSYQMGNIDFPHHQLAHADTLEKIEKINFRSIDTDALLLTLSHKGSRTIYPRKEDVPDRKSISSPSAVIRNPEPKNEIVKETFSVPLKNISFKFGCVSFEKWIHQVNKTIEFTILNPEIREEFEAVKNYFSNVLNTKKIQVDIEIHITNNEIKSKQVSSPEISRIDKDLIDNVRFEFIKGLSKRKILAENEKLLFTMDEFFDTLTEEQVKANTFYSSDNDLLEDLMQITNTKHYKYLRFLSSKHAHSKMKLRFMIKPFSFIFLLEGENNYHIVWETLDTTEATYIWHIDKDLNKLKSTFKKLESTITKIKLGGKIAYISSTEDNFKRIYHDYSELIDGFVKWKAELNNILT